MSDYENVPQDTPDIRAWQREQLAQLFPEAFSEGKVDFEKLRAGLGDTVETLRERYSFTWAGKQDAILNLQTPSRATLKPARDESVDFDTTRNIFIEGENLEVLKLLYKSYFGRVKMIYIDPPYNTGNDFIYRDNYAHPLDGYMRLTGQKAVNGDMLTSNPETNGRYHSAWLSMMYPRLFVARQLLREDGVIFVSIDDHEVHNLRMLMNEVFGEENFVATVIWQKLYSGKADATHFGRFHEYILCYARNAATVEINLLPRTEEMNMRYTNPDDDPRGLWLSNDLTAAGERSRGHFDIVSPSGKVFDSPRGKHWLYSPETMTRLLDEQRIWFGKDGTGFPRLKRFLSEVQQGQRANTIWLHEDVGHTDEATKEVRNIFGESDCLFDTAKPSRLLKRILQLSTESNGENIILDFFAGSGTMMQAVAELNNEDNGNRRFIVVQLPEPTGCFDYPTIAEIGKERIRRVIARMRQEAAGQLDLSGRETPEDLGFRVFKLSESNYRPWPDLPADTTTPDEYIEQMKLFEDPLVYGWQVEDVITEVALKEGYSLTSRIEWMEQVAGPQVYRVTDDDKGQSFYICLDNSLESIEPLRALKLREDDLFVWRSVALNDTLAANLTLQCRLKMI